MIKNSVRILSGDLKGRKLTFIETEGLRPTPIRVRQTLFNWLRADIYNQSCLDLFAGSGAIGVEAISQGACKVTFVEKNRNMTQLLKENLLKIKIPFSKFQIINSSHKQFIESEVSKNNKYDVIFLDPPFSLEIIPELLESIKQLSPKFIYVENNIPLDKLLENNDDYELYKHKKAGSVYFGLLRSIAE